MNTEQFHSTVCAHLAIMAERELAAFIGAVTESYGAGQARFSARIWLSMLESMDRLPGPTARDWRAVTVEALARLAKTDDRYQSIDNTIVQLFGIRGSDLMHSAHREGPHYRSNA